MKNNAYVICNNNEFNHLIISDMMLIVNNIKQENIKEVPFSKIDKKVIIDTYYIDIDDEHLDIVEECVKRENITLSILSVDGEILSVFQIH